jgi:hypothetical protein
LTKLDIALDRQAGRPRRGLRRSGRADCAVLDAAEQRGEIGARPRRAEQEALALGAILRAQEVELLGRLDPLGGGDDAEAGRGGKSP